MTIILHHNPRMGNKLVSLLSKESETRFVMNPDSSKWLTESSIILIEPFIWEDQFLSLYGIWADYLEKYEEVSSTSKLKVAGIASTSPCPNYLDLMNPQMEEWLKKHDPRPEGQLGKIYESYHFNGIDIRLLMRRFLEGHGKHLFYENFEFIHGKFKSARTFLEEGTSYEVIEKKILREINLEKVEILIDRWEKFEKYFEFLPPEWQIKKHKSLLEELLYFIGEGQYEEALFRESDLGDRLSKVFQIVEELRQLYPPIL